LRLKKQPDDNVLPVMGFVITLPILRVMKQVRFFKTSWFNKAAKKANIPDEALCKAIYQVMQGQADDLVCHEKQSEI
jgi:hypothetical protein